MTPTPDMLPRWLRVSFIGITEFPRTNSITLAGIIAFLATCAFLGVASVLGYAIDPVVLTVHYSAVLAVMGVGNWAESIKRSLPYPAPPAATSLDAADVAATSGTPKPAAGAATVPQPDSSPVLGKAAAQLAAEVLEARTKEIASEEAVG